VIARPFGRLLAGPLLREKAILYGEIDREASARARKSLDVAGHYARPDVFQLKVNRAPMPSVAFEDG
jgi:nitrilase